MRKKKLNKVVDNEIKKMMQKSTNLILIDNGNLHIEVNEEHTIVDIEHVQQLSLFTFLTSLLVASITENHLDSKTIDTEITVLELIIELLKSKR